MPLQGQKNVEVKEEKNDEKNLYRDISTPNFRKNEIFELTEISRNRLSRDRCFRRIGNFRKTIFLLVTQDPVQPLCNQVQITDKEILEQEDKGKNDESYKSVIVYLVSRAQNALARAMALYAKQNNSIELMS